MQSWQFKALELEASVLKFLDGIIADYGLGICVGFVYLLIPFSIWALSGGLRRRLLKGKPMPHLRPVIVVHIPIGQPPPPPEPFVPFPPYHEPPDFDCDGYYED